jgi:hypothetical protein
MSAREITLDEVRRIPTPPPTRSSRGGHRPIPHEMLIDLASDALREVGYRVGSERYTADKDGARLFVSWGLISEGCNNSGKGSQLSVGLRNAHDKKFASGGALGSWVLVCSNLDFGAEFTFGRKHTAGIMADLPRQVLRLVEHVPAFAKLQDQREESYRSTSLDDAAAHDIVIRAVDVEVIPTQSIPKVLSQWRQPEHAEFSPRNVYSLQNAFTNVLRGSNVFDLSARTRSLHPLLTSAAESAGHPVGWEIR